LSVYEDKRQIFIKVAVDEKSFASERISLRGENNMADIVTLTKEARHQKDD
jgi:hypothetical protein